MTTSLVRSTDVEFKMSVFNTIEDKFVDKFLERKTKTVRVRDEKKQAQMKTKEKVDQFVAQVKDLKRKENKSPQVN